jgi:nitroreductase
LLETSTWAPTHGLTQPWHFFVFTGDSRKSLADNLQRIYKAITPVESQKEETYRKLGEQPLMSPAVIVIGMMRDANGKIHHIEEVEAVACAVQNFHLSASSVGLGVSWTSPPLCYTREMTRYLDLRDGDECLGMLHIGWPRPDFIWPDSMKREPVERKLTWM